MQIAGKIALVTGAASGIGRVVAQELAAAGAAVVVVDIDAVGAAETVLSIEQAGGRAVLAEADVASPAGIRAMYRAAELAFGGVDIVHNNAGIVCGGTSSWPDTPLENIIQVISTNLGGVTMGTRAAIDALRARGGGVVVNTSSVTALVPFPKDPVYMATKAGIVLFTQSCKPLRESHNIRVNAVMPLLVDTPMLLKVGDGTALPDWLAEAVAMMPPVPPSVVAAEVLEIVRDDSLAGETRAATP